MYKKRILLYGLIGIGIFLIGFFVLLFLEAVRPNHYRTNLSGTTLNRLILAKCYGVNWSGFEDSSNAIIGSGHLKLQHIKQHYLSNEKPFYLFAIVFKENDLFFYKNWNLKNYFGIIIDPQTGFVKRALDKGFYKGVKYKLRRFFHGLPIVISPGQSIPYKNERESLTPYGINGFYYFNLIQDDWLKDTSYVDALIEIFNSAPENAVFYFHCMNGKGRTTTFMALYDIYKNYNRLPLDAIINRHYCLGGEDLFDIDASAQGSWFPDALLARKNLVELFYKYMQDMHHKDNPLTWSEWLSETKNNRLFNVSQYKK